MSGRSKRIYFLIITILVLLRLPTAVEAVYILPYPSYMPGSKLYSVSRMIDRAKGWWHWGTIAQTKYALSLSDKYLVEAKTLFEYGQYLLATDALARSNTHMMRVVPLLEQGVREGKDIERLAQTSLDAAGEHIRIVAKLREELPPSAEWNPENGQRRVFDFALLLDEAVSIRLEHSADVVGML